MSGDPRAGSAPQIAAKVRPRRDHVYVETRHCHHCQQQGHLRQVCPIAKQDKHGAHDEEADNARYVCVETRHCHHCQQQGHLRQACPTAKQDAAKQDKHGADDEEAGNARRLSADPLPILHGDREVHWQGATREVPAHPHQEASQEYKHGEDDEEADNVGHVSSDPLPIRHGDREEGKVISPSPFWPKQNPSLHVAAHGSACAVSMFPYQRKWVS